jgi:hypothetical protein
VPAFNYELTDTGLVGGIRFFAITDARGYKLIDSPEDAIHRMACIYMISCLDRDNLLDAYGNITEMFAWQQKVATHAPTIVEHVHPFTVSMLERTPSPPFGNIEE